MSGVPLQCHIMRGQASYGVRCNTWLQQNCLQNKLKRPVTLSILISVLYKLAPPSGRDPFCQLEVDQAELLCEERTWSFQNSFVKVNLSHFASPRSIWAAGWQDGGGGCDGAGGRLLDQDGELGSLLVSFPTDKRGGKPDWVQYWPW